MNKRTALLTLEDGHVFEGFSFGWEGATAGELVFNTGMVGYPESLTDPSYYGQILVMTYPLIGNYGVPEFKPDSLYFESDRIQVRGLIVADYSADYCHWNAHQSLGDWLKSQKIPAITGIDTRTLTQILREEGAMLAKITFDNDIDYYDPNRYNVVAEVTCTEPRTYGQGKKRIALLDCGCKRSIISQLSQHKIEIMRLPWDSDLTKYDFNGLCISNGPGDPRNCEASVASVRLALENKIPTLGICLGNQILALAIGAKTYKLKYGHRGQNQPVIDQTSGCCYITSQNHGFAVDDKSLPEDWRIWFSNLNDRTNEGLIHRSGRYMSVQFHPEAATGPLDTMFVFDRFLDIL